MTRSRRESTRDEAVPTSVTPPAVGAAAGTGTAAGDVRNLELDGLRALAVACMVVFHAFFLLPVTWSWAYPWLLRFDMSVEVFFMLSGFLIYGPYGRAHIRGAAPPRLGRYALRRVVRIYPAYWVAVGTMLALGWVRFGDGAEVLQHLTLTQGYFPRTHSHFVFSSGLGQGWTLVVEVSFYAFVPLWAWAMRRLAGTGRVDPFRQEVAGALVLFAAGVVAAALVAARPLPVPFGVLPTHLTSLSWGMLLAIVATRWSGPPAAPEADPEPAWVAAEGDVAHLSVSPELAGVLGAVPTSVSTAVPTAGPAPARRGWPAVPGWLRRSATEVSWLAAWGVMALGSLRLDELSAEPGHLRLLQVVNFAAGALLVTPVLLGAPGRGWVRGLLTWRPVVFLGVVSYGVYLWHLDVFVDLPGPWEPEPTGPGLAGMAAKAVVALAAGVASFHLLERPLMRWADRRTRRAPAAVLRDVPVRDDVPAGVE